MIRCCGDRHTEDTCTCGYRLRLGNGLCGHQPISQRIVRRRSRIGKDLDRFEAVIEVHHGVAQQQVIERSHQCEGCHCGSVITDVRSGLVDDAVDIIDGNEAAISK